MSVLRCMPAALALLLCAASVSAHHSRAGFAMDSVVAVQGTVTRFDWSNPHVFIYVESDDGAEWEIETDAIAILARNGWTSDALEPGDVVSVRGNPGKEPGARHALLVSVRTADGRVLAPRGDVDATRAVARASDISGVWELPTDYGDFNERWAAASLTEKGAAALAEYDSQLHRPATRCIAMSSPGLLTMPFLNEIQIEDEVVTIRSEFFNSERTIYTDGRGHPENGERTNQGHSIGRWEDDVLVVDTRLFADHRAPIRGPNEGVPSGAQRHLMERFYLSEDRTRLIVEFVVEDPEYLAEPFSGRLELVYSPELEMLGFDCDPAWIERYLVE